MNKIIKVGFDMDGVILYNPIRFVRPIAKLLKPLKTFILGQKSESFYFPSSPIEQFLFDLLHKTSFMADPALKDLERLVKEKKIEAYIITGRYSFLKNDYEKWLKVINKNKIFKACYQNIDNSQPNEFKQKMIKKLNLDIYIEDNLDIVNKIQNKNSKIFWITNILDKNISYKYKFNNLREALQNLK